VQVSEKYFTLAKQTFPSLTRDEWDKGMNGHGGTFADDASRVAWKYTCSRGKTGTPLYSLNGVPFEADPTWGLEDWLKAIDPLVQANNKIAHDTKEITLLKESMVRLGGVPRVPDRKVHHFAKHSDTTSLARVCSGVVNGHRPCEFLPRRAMCCQHDEACVLRTGCVKL
jgi:hypothetical protein